MTTKRKVLLAVIIAAAAVIIAVAVILAFYMNSGSGSYNTLLSRGEKALDSGDYDNAVLYYQQAIDLEPDEEDGYIGLANAYLAQNTDNTLTLAQTVLNSGYARTSSLRIYNMLLRYFPDDGEGDGNEEKEQAEELVTDDIKEESGDLALNTDLLDTIISSTYDDYRLSGQIDSESTEGGVYTATLSALGIELKFYNTESNSHIIDPNTNKPYSTCKPNTVRVTSLNVLLGASSVTYEELSAMELSSLSLAEDDTYGWVVSFSYQECSIQFASDENGTIAAGAENELIPPRTVTATAGSNVLSGRVLSATTGSGVSGAKLEITPASGGATTTVTSETGGYYTAELDPGTYDVTISCSGYITETFSTMVYSGAATTENFTISTTLGADEIRIVLDWGASPTDLDSWLYGTTDSGESVATSYRNKRSTGSDGTVLAELDVDDTDGYGPETTTIYDTNGTYRFYVADFTGSGTMSNSGATVKVYVGNSTPVTIQVCSGLENGWYVCTIDHGVVTVVNTAASTVSANPK